MRAVVLAGGRSSEHEVSLASGRSVAAGLARGGHDVVEVIVGRDGVWRSRDEELVVCPGRGLLGSDVVFPVLHGPYGEDGTIQGLLECLDVAYVGAGVLASAVCMDKLVFKALMARAGIPQVAHAAAPLKRWREDRPGLLAELGGLGLPVFVKPARLGSSLGIARVTEPAELPAALDAAYAHDPRVIVEAMAGGLELECSVAGDDPPQASEPGEIVLDDRATGGWYDFEAKYTPGGMELVVPARVAPEVARRVRELALAAFAASSASGLARVDFFVEPDADAGAGVLVNELNTMPGFTETSVYGRLFAASGVPYVQLLDRLAQAARERHDQQGRFRC